ncbi:MAG: sulfatase-like hydrolase/transferase, partial [Phycisphaerae bacterium]|nr:sulfatase-like hydrolase/transferase [Phycisphaerae bacterium]
NIVFIFADQHRHDAFGCAGNPLIETPNIDRLAGRGVRFTNAWCQSPICQPSRAALITGRYPHEVGV